MRELAPSTYIVDDMAFQADAAKMMRKLHIKEGRADATDFLALLDHAVKIARPKALYKVAYIEAKSEDTVTLDGIVFTSRVLRVNLDVAHRVFAYVATCGTELDDWAQSLDDMVYSFWADSIKQAALSIAVQTLTQHLKACYELGRTATMAPGSLADWPIQQQRPLFALLGDVQATIGVHLTDSLLMVPNKTVSGIRFPTEERFESCQLCPRETCPGRRAAYDATLYERKYQNIG